MALISIKNFAGEQKALFSYNLIDSVVAGAVSKGLGSFSAITTIGSGYTLAESADSSIVSTVGSSVKGSKIDILWGEGIADVTVDNGGVFEATGALSAVLTFKGSKMNTAFAATVTSAVITGSTNREVTAVTVTDPGIYIPLDVYRDYSIEIVSAGITITRAKLTPVIALYPFGAGVDQSGGGGAGATALVTLKAPAAKLGQATIAASTITFDTVDIIPSSYSINGTFTDILVNHSKVTSIFDNLKTDREIDTIIIREEW